MRRQPTYSDEMMVERRSDQKRRERFSSQLNQPTGALQTDQSDATIGQSIASLIRDSDSDAENDVKAWRLPQTQLFSEMFSLMNCDGPWINLSDGGHLENMGCMELLRRRCAVVFVCDGEADEEHSFDGMANLIRLAKLDLRIDITIDLEKSFALDEKRDARIISALARSNTLQPQKDNHARLACSST